MAHAHWSHVVARRRHQGVLRHACAPWHPHMRRRDGAPGGRQSWPDATHEPMVLGSGSRNKTAAGPEAAALREEPRKTASRTPDN